METLDGCLMLEHVVLATEEMHPYVLAWSLQEDSDETAEVTVLVLMRRENGLLLGLPTGFLPQETLDVANAADSGDVLGPSMTFRVPGLISEGGHVAQTGEELEVLVIDCAEEILHHMREFRDTEEVIFGFDEDSPFAYPAVDALLPRIRAWAVATSDQLANFYSPEEDGTPMQEPQTPVGRRQPARRATPSGAGAKQKPKRVTNVSIAQNLESVLATLPKLSQQMEQMSERQLALERQFPSLGRSTAVAVSQPLGSSLDLPQPSMSTVAKALHPPPRTVAAPSLGLLGSPCMTGKQLELEELQAERVDHGVPSNQISGDTMAQAVLAQSQALTALVAQIASATGDPIAELTGVAGPGSRGASGRAKLQSELAMHRGTFFRQVMQQMSRRMSPTSSADLSAKELLEKGISGVRYLERFGGYGRCREIGQMQFQVMTAFDFLMAGKVEAAMDTIALLAVSLEQASLDGGRMDLASLLCLQEDAPASIFMNRQLTATSRARAFAPLADQRWITCALAFLKELEVIQTKRAELTSGANRWTSDGSQDSQAVPERKAKAKPKPGPKKKGGGKGSAAEDSQDA